LERSHQNLTQTGLCLVAERIGGSKSQNRKIEKNAWLTTYGEVNNYLKISCWGRGIFEVI